VLRLSPELPGDAKNRKPQLLPADETASRKWQSLSTRPI
jgi:hypothetical protein